MNPVKTDSGYVSGTVLGEPGNEVHVYRGIPYAAPPVGDLRWKPPQPVAAFLTKTSGRYTISASTRYFRAHLFCYPAEWNCTCSSPRR